MISQSAFAIYQEQAAKRKYSSLQYAEYEDCQMADEVYADDETLVLCDAKQTPAKLDFAANDFDQVMDRINKIENPLRINFVPYECQQQMLRNGFEIWAEYVDYFNLNLMEASVKPIASGLYEVVGERTGFAAVQTMRGAIQRLLRRRSRAFCQMVG